MNKRPGGMVCCVCDWTEKNNLELIVNSIAAGDCVGSCHIVSIKTNQTEIIKNFARVEYLLY